MKNYYAECCVNHKNVNDDGVSYDDFEFYTFIIQANNKKEGYEKAKQRALEEFTAEFNEDGQFVVDSVEVDEFYQTTEDARAD